jgi:carboxyl-terminal processing protease
MRFRPAAVAAMFGLSVLLLAGCKSGTTTAARAPATAPALSDEQRRLNVESFDYVWTTIELKHYDPKTNGVDWPAVRDELRPKVEAATSMSQARAVMDDMISRLHQTHFAIIPAEVYDTDRDSRHGDDDESSDHAGHGHGDHQGGDHDRSASSQPTTADAAGRRGEAVSGLSVRIVDGKVLVISVLPGSGAEKAGIKPGWELISVHGRPVGQINKLVAQSVEEPRLVNSIQALTLASLMTGKAGHHVRAEFIDGRGRHVKERIELTRPPGTLTVFGNVPPLYVDIETRRIDGDIGYISLNCFFDPGTVMGKINAAMPTFADCRGIIIDLRGNPGGLGFMANGIGGWFVDKKQSMGKMIMRRGYVGFMLNPRPRPFDGPLAIVVDDCSMSTSEILAGGLKDIGRARIFGVQTPGAALPSQVDVLPNGDRFQYATADYVSAGGKRLEGLGVTPDVIAPPDRQDLLAGRDPALDAAVKWIQSQGPATKSVAAMSGSAKSGN